MGGVLIKMERKPFDRDSIELIAYMLTSARNLTDEPALYGPFRLLEGVSRLCDLLLEAGHSDKAFLTGLKEKIDNGKFSVMTDVESFTTLMDEVVLDITRLLIGNTNK